MPRRKWRKSAFVCANFGDVIKSCISFGGVWRNDIQKFATRSWVASQQIDYLKKRTRLGVFYYPEPCERWKGTTKEKDNGKNG